MARSSTGRARSWPGRAPILPERRRGSGRRVYAARTDSHKEMTAMDVIASLDQMRAAINVLEHPFYERWSAGELTACELSCYAGEYRLAVRALAEASRLAAEKSEPAQLATLRAHAREEADHVELWERFASAAGARPASGADGDGER